MNLVFLLTGDTIKSYLQLRFKMPKYNNLETINLKFKISVSQAEIHVTYLPNSLS